MDKFEKKLKLISDVLELVEYSLKQREYSDEKGMNNLLNKQILLGCIKQDIIDLRTMKILLNREN